MFENFLMLGGQLRNSSAYDADAVQKGFEAIAAFGGNTAELPVYWEQVEPQEGRFHFDHVGRIIEAARARGLKLILLWFGTWKNATDSYVPEWVKTDPERFPVVQTPSGAHLASLSPLGTQTLQADKTAFCALMAYLKQVDGQTGTVIAIQVENEPGALGCDRDYAPAAQSAFAGPVPACLGEGSWNEVYGWRAAEAFSAWHIARYIDQIAQAGQAVYDLPMYANAWLSHIGLELPGQDYPSGGPVPPVLEIWGKAAPHLFTLAPDIYIQNLNLCRRICEEYTASGAPLLIPESAANVSGAMMLTRAIADFGAVGVAAFGIEGILDSRGEVLPQALPWVLQMRVFKAMTPLLLKYRGAGRVHAVVQEEWSGSEHLIFADGWQGAVNFGFLNTDHAHNRDKLVDRGWDQLRGMGLIVQGEEDTFYLGGMGYYLRLYRPGWQDGASELAMNSAFALRQSPYLSVEEGCFEPDGTWRTLRRRNGDETDGGLWVHPDTLVRVRLYRR